MNDNNPIILFDGICNLCNSSVNFILKRDKKKQFHFVSLQSDEGKELIKRYKIPQETDSVILIRKNEIFIESDAALKIIGLLPTPWKWLTIFKIIPIKWRNKIYNWVAKNRYKWFGKRDVCNFGDE